VYRWEDPDRADDVTKVEIGTVLVGSDGKLVLLPVDAEDPNVGPIRKLLTAIEQKGTLPTTVEQYERVDGIEMLVLKDAEVKPGDPAYHHAVAGLLRRAGFIV